MLLHCTAAAETGGENGLLDHEIAYIRLRDKDPDHIEALMHPEAMTIPARAMHNTEPSAQPSEAEPASYVTTRNWTAPSPANPRKYPPRS